MTTHQSGIAGARKYFLLAGLVTGLAVSSWYLYRNHLLATQLRPGVLPDPIWTRFVNVGLIMFAAFFQFSVIHKLVMLVSGRIGRGSD